jgi:putative ABC transport system permease protein
MFRNYFKTAIRNLLRHKGFAIINIASLTIGLISCMVIGLFVWDERQYDKHIPGGENVYRIYEQRNNNEAITYAACVPPAFATFLESTYPEVDTTLRILMTQDEFLVERAEKRNYEKKGLFVEGSFFSIFPLKFLAGNPATALKDPANIVLTEELARKYFGQENALGKTIRMNKGNYTVTGVLAKLPAHFHLDFRYLVPLSAAGLPTSRMERWTWHQFYTYVKLKPGARVQPLQEKFQGHVKKEIFPTLRQAGSTFLPYFQSLQNIHLQSADFIYDNALRGNETYVNALSLIALFVLVIACFNFINLATARSFRRAREIGVRKVIGAQRKQLLAVAATWFVVPWLNEFTGKFIVFNPFTNPLLGSAILLGGIITGILAGIYPALVLSGFQPVKVLKSLKLTGSSGSHWLRQSLVVIQFTLSLLLIVAATIVYKQTKYLNNKDLGFNKEQVVYFEVRGEVPNNLKTFKSELRRSPSVVAVTSGYGLPGDMYAGDGVIIPGREGDKELQSNVFIGDYDYVKTLGLRLVAGRDFSRTMARDVQEAFLINETAVKEFGFGTPEQAIGQRINWNEWEPIDTLHRIKQGRVIGVVQDLHYKSLHEKVTASVIQLYPQVTVKVAVKLKTTDIKKTMAYINTAWNKFAPTYPINYQFMDETYGNMYESEEKLADLLWIFTVLAIVIGCMGLFGLASLSAAQRTRELGIRKVLGAGVLDIVTLFSKNFVLLVLVAALIACPVAWWAMNSWLDDFPYRVSVSIWVFLIAIVAALGIALLTVSFQSIRSALANPVKAIRSE